MHRRAVSSEPQGSPLTIAGRIAALVVIGLASACAAPSATVAATTADVGAADRAAALAAVHGLFDAMATRDAAKAAALVVPEGAFVVTMLEGGARRQRSATLQSFLETLAHGTGALDEHFTEPPQVLVDGDVAIVWGRYAFLLDGKPSHTGVDALTLIRTDAGWKIAGGAYSVIR